MNTNRLMTGQTNTLGAFLRDRRSRLDPATLGLPAGRRRTPGLRREEVALRAHISPTWYTWLEQGRGGPPSVEVLERVAAALLLSTIEKEHLFLLALGRPPSPPVPLAAPVSPRLQRLIDAMPLCPAIIRDTCWNVVAWNAAACAVLTDYNVLPPGQRNILKLLFCDPAVRARQHDWEAMAAFVVGAFRAECWKMQDSPGLQALVAELHARSPEFSALWGNNEVLLHGEGNKYLRHPQLGAITLEYSSFSVEGRPDLGLVIYTPAAHEDRQRVQALIQARTGSPPVEPTVGR